VPSSLLVRAVLGLLVIATIGSFLWTQRLKNEDPLILSFARSPKSFSPDGDGVRDRVKIGFDLSDSVRLAFSVIDRRGREVREIVRDRRFAGDRRHRFLWDGRDEAGRVVPEGRYRMRAVRLDEGLTLNSVKRIRVRNRRLASRGR
jgi:hypothetical protein